METKLIKDKQYKLTKAPNQLKVLVGSVVKVITVVRNKTHRAYEVTANGIVIGFSAAELRAKTFILEKVAEEVTDSQPVAATQG